MMGLLATIFSCWCAAYWAGKHVGYKDGLHDGVEMEREAWEHALADDPDPDGGGEPLPRPLSLAEVRAANRTDQKLKVVS